MEPSTPESPVDRPDQALARVEEFRRAGEEALRQAHARLEDAQESLSRSACQFPDRVRDELASLDRLISESKTSSERHAAEFQRRFLEGTPSAEEFRARLLMLDMEYSSRLKFAEEGIRLLRTNLDGHLGAMGAGVSRFFEQALEALGRELYPAHARLTEALGEALRFLQAHSPRSAQAAGEDDAAAESWRLLGEAEKLRRVLEKRNEDMERIVERVRGEAREAEASARRFAEALQGERARLIAETGERERLAGEVSALSRQLNEACSGLELSRRRENAAQAPVEGAAELRRAQEELQALRRSLEASEDAAQKLREEAAGLWARLEAAAAQPKPPANAAEAEVELARTREAVSRMEEEKLELRNNLSAARRRIVELERERAKTPTAAAWNIEKEELEERLTAAERDLANFRSAHEASQASWERILSRQDAMRLDEIFKLRGQIEGLKARLYGGAA